MSLWRKLNTLFKATSTEPLNQLVEANSLKIFEQEIQDAERAITHSKKELACVVAEKNRTQREIALLSENIAMKESQAIEAMDKDKGELALEIADQLVADQSLLSQQRQQAAYLLEQESFLKQQLKDAVQRIKRYRGELRLAKANRSAEQALTLLQNHSQGLNGAMSDMAVSVDSIRERHQHFQDFNKALRQVEAECSGDLLAEKLSENGIDHGDHAAQKVLDQLRKRQAA